MSHLLSVNHRRLLLLQAAEQSTRRVTTKSLFDAEIPLPSGYHLAAPSQNFVGSFPFASGGADDDGTEVENESQNKRNDSAPLVHGLPISEWAVCGSLGKIGGYLASKYSHSNTYNSSSFIKHKPIVGPWDPEVHTLVSEFISCNSSPIE